ncbi:class I SAM-dependent methyltransferase [Corynebacterium resistens]|nr:class I SAM-dependent methyltransferase [Corynebacterium resistens]
MFPRFPKGQRAIRRLRAFNSSPRSRLRAFTLASRTHQTLKFWRPQATFRRAWGLLSDFKYEQTRPDIFYGHLAADTVSLIAAVWRGATASDKKTANHPNRPSNGRSLAGTRVLDVGGGPGYFGVAFSEADAEYFTCEPDVGEMAAAGIKLQSSVRGSGLDLPFLDDSFDITYSSNVAEHVPDPWRMADEMLRVTKPGGIVIYSYTVWLGPFGGHETGLWEHYVGGEFAARRYRKRHGKEPKNRWGESLFDVSAADGVRYGWSTEGPGSERTYSGRTCSGDTCAGDSGSGHGGSKRDLQEVNSAGTHRFVTDHDLVAAATANGTAEFIAAFPRYHPWWAWWAVHIPVFREFAVSNLVIVLRKK